MPSKLPARDLAARLIEMKGSDALAQATRMVAEASVGGTDDDADLCADLMNELVPLLRREAA